MEIEQLNISSTGLVELNETVEPGFISTETTGSIEPVVSVDT